MILNCRVTLQSKNCKDCKRPLWSSSSTISSPPPCPLNFTCNRPFEHLQSWALEFVRLPYRSLHVLYNCCVIYIWSFIYFLKRVWRIRPWHTNKEAKGVKFQKLCGIHRNVIVISPIILKLKFTNRPRHVKWYQSRQFTQLCQILYGLKNSRTLYVKTKCRNDVEQLSLQRLPNT